MDCFNRYGCSGMDIIPRMKYIHTLGGQRWFRLCCIALLFVWIVLNLINPANASSVSPMFIEKPIQNIQQIAYKLRYIPNFTEGAANATAYTYKSVSYSAARAGALGRSFLFGPWGNAALLALTAAGYYWDSQNQIVGPLVEQTHQTDGYDCKSCYAQSSCTHVGYAPSKTQCGPVLAASPGIGECWHNYFGTCVKYASAFYYTPSGSNYSYYCDQYNVSNHSLAGQISCGAASGGLVSNTNGGAGYDWPPDPQGAPLTDEQLAPLFNPGQPLNPYGPDIYQDPFGDPEITPELQDTMDAWKNEMDKATDGDANTIGDPNQLQDTTTTPETDPAAHIEQVTDCNLLPTLCAFIDWFKTDLSPPEIPVLPVQENDVSVPQSWSTGFGSGSCPAPRNTIFQGQSIGYDFTAACQGAAWFKPIMIAAASLSAGFILLGVRSS